MPTHPHKQTFSRTFCVVLFRKGNSSTMTSCDLKSKPTLHVTIPIARVYSLDAQNSNSTVTVLPWNIQETTHQTTTPWTQFGELLCCTTTNGFGDTLTFHQIRLRDFYLHLYYSSSERRMYFSQHPGVNGGGSPLTIEPPPRNAPPRHHRLFIEWMSQFKQLTPRLALLALQIVRESLVRHYLPFQSNVADYICCYI